VLTQTKFNSVYFFIARLTQFLFSLAQNKEAVAWDTRQADALLHVDKSIKIRKINGTKKSRDI
jgi:hypothetical protein